MNGEQLIVGAALDGPSEIWLLGQKPLGNYLKFLDSSAIDIDDVQRTDLIDEWSSANAHYEELASTEAGIADEIEVLDLDPQLEPLVDALIADPRYQRSFNMFDRYIAMVELEKLLVGHPYVSQNHTNRIRKDLGATPTPEALFKLCLPLDREEAPVAIKRLGSRRYLFRSQSSDFRFQEAALLDPGQVSDFEPMGAVGGILGLFMGYGSNFLNLIEYGDRLLLHNGHHRAYALCEAGISHAPCIIQTVTRGDELRHMATAAVAEDPNYYFSAPRPPVLKDFFDSKIRKVHRVNPMANLIEVSFDVKTHKKTTDFTFEDGWQD